MSTESDGVEAFTGTMSTPVIRRKLEILKDKKAAIKTETERLESILAEREYSKKTVREVEEIWNGLSRYGRWDMCWEIPVIRREIKTSLEEGTRSAEEIENDFEIDFADVHNIGLQIRTYFEDVCNER